MIKLDFLGFFFLHLFRVGTTGTQQWYVKQFNTKNNDQKKKSLHRQEIYNELHNYSLKADSLQNLFSNILLNIMMLKKITHQFHQETNKPYFNHAIRTIKPSEIHSEVIYSTNSPGKLNVTRIHCDSLGMDGTEISIWEQQDKECLCSLKGIRKKNRDDVAYKICK